MDAISRNPKAAAFFSVVGGVILWGREWKLLGGTLVIGGAAAGVYILRSQSEEKKVVEEETTAVMETIVEEVTIEKPKKVEQAKADVKKIKSFLEKKPEYQAIQGYVKQLLADGPLDGELLKAFTPEICNHQWARAFIQGLATSDVWKEEELRLEASEFADPANAVHTALYCHKWECEEPISLEAFLLLFLNQRKPSLKVHTEVGADADEKAILASLKRGAEMLCTYGRQETCHEKQGKVGWRPWVDLARAYLVHKEGDLTGWEGAAKAADAFCRMGHVMTVNQKVVFVPFSRGGQDYKYAKNCLKSCTKENVSEMYDYLNQDEKALVDSV